jgi:hypothetical protein
MQTQTQIAPKERSPRRRISYDKMKKYEKVEPVKRLSQKEIMKETVKNEKDKQKIRDYLQLLSETEFKGRFYTYEAKGMIREAKSLGIEIPENLNHIK